jgi:Flp pilus assembly protein TadD
MTAEKSIRAFVRNAWVLLAFQLVAAAAALGVTAWATLEERPLLSERERLEKAIADSMVQLDDLRTQQDKARDEIAALEKQAAVVRAELKGARDATPVLTEAINAFHRKDYARAIAKYDEALKLNPGDPYVYNLKSYSQFKAGDVAGAIDTLSRSLEMDPSYEWGYFDLARYQCAAGSPDAAVHTIKSALEARGKSIRRATAFFLAKDGEFRHLCAPVIAELRELAK